MLSLIEFALEHVSFLKISTSFMIIRIFRLFRILRMVKGARNLKIIFDIFAKALPAAATSYLFYFISLMILKKKI